MADNTVGGSVTNSFGTRVGGVNMNAAQDRAATIATGVIDTVNYTLNALSNSGSQSLDAALVAIDALAAFHPAQVVVRYAPPSFGGINWRPAIAPVKTDVDTDINDPDTSAEITLEVATPAPPGIGGSAPEASEFEFRDAPPVQSVGGAPTPYKAFNVSSTGNPPTTTTFGGLKLSTYTVPTLRDLVVPTAPPTAVGGYTSPDGNDAPDEPPLAAQISLPGYARSFVPADAVDLHGSLIGHLLKDRELLVATDAWVARGQPSPVEMSREAFEKAALGNAAERRRLFIDVNTWTVETARMTLSAAVEADGLLVMVSLQMAKIKFEANTLIANAHLQLIDAMVTLYNGRVTEFSAVCMEYETYLEALLIPHGITKALIDAEISKTRANDQLASVFSAQVQAKLVYEGVYSAEVDAIFAEAEGYSALMKGVVATAQAAIAGIEGYKGTTAAYIAELQRRKAEYDQYSATAKVVVSRNAAERAIPQLSAAEASAAGAMAAHAAALIDMDAEALKAQAAKISSTYEPVKLHNAIEGMRAQAQADAGRVDLAHWTAEMRTRDVENEAAVETAQQAQRFYNSASDSAYRAAEHTLRAITSSTQASTIAQDAAGRVAASVAQGAYSAVHISASLQGSGHVNGSEDTSGRNQQHFTDMFGYTEERHQSLSA